MSTLTTHIMRLVVGLYKVIVDSLLVIRMTIVESDNSSPRMRVETSTHVMVLHAPECGSDWCHVCLSEGVRQRSDECDDVEHTLSGDITVVVA